MHTARLLTVSPSVHCAGGGRVSAPEGGAWSRGGLLPGGVSASIWGGGIPACTEADPPWTEFLTHTTENITLLQTSFVGGKYIT